MTDKKIITSRKKVFNISVIKVTDTYPDGEIVTYNDIKTTPNLGKRHSDFLGHKDFPNRVDDIVDYLERKDAENNT